MPEAAVILLCLPSRPERSTEIFKNSIQVIRVGSRVGGCFVQATFDAEQHSVNVELFRRAKFGRESG